MTTKHARYTFSYNPQQADEHPVIHQYILDEPDQLQSIDAVAQVFLGFLSDVAGYEVTLDMLTEKAAAA